MSSFRPLPRLPNTAVFNIKFSISHPESWISCNWPLLFLSLFPSLPHPPPCPRLAFATRYTQMLLYCCMTESDTEEEIHGGIKTQWSCKQTPKALFTENKALHVLSNEEQALSVCEDFSNERQIIWETGDLISSVNVLHFSTESKEYLLWGYTFKNVAKTRFLFLRVLWRCKLITFCLINTLRNENPTVVVMWSQSSVFRSIFKLNIHLWIFFLVWLYSYVDDCASVKHY